MPIEVTRMAKPAEAAIHHWSTVTYVPSATIDPHSDVGHLETDKSRAAAGRAIAYELER